MRVSIDTNVLISYLLFPARETSSTKLMLAALNEDYELRLSEQTISELLDTIGSSRYLSERIYEPLLLEFVQNLRHIGSIAPGYISKQKRVVRDPQVDYLIAHALAEKVDYLVTGDKDLLVLERVEDVLIVTPAEFVFMLEHEQD